MTSTLDQPQAYPFNRFDGLELAPQYAWALRQTGLTRITLPFDGDAWLATRYADVRLVLSDRRFSRAEAARRNCVPRAFPRIAGGIVIMDPPEFTRLRKLALQAFTVRRVEALRPHVRGFANRLVDVMVSRSAPADLVADYALPIPMSVICELLGVPVADQPRFKIWNDSLLSTNALSAEQTQRNLGELSQYIMGLIGERQAGPQDDLISAMIRARDQDDRLSQSELVLLCIAILVAGYEGVSSHIPNFIHTLLAQPEALERLRREPDRIPGAVEELLRLIPLASAAMFVHFAQEDVQVGDTLPWYGAGKRCLPRWAPPIGTRDDSPIPTSWISAMRRQGISLLGTACIAASAPVWPGSNCRKHCVFCWSACRISIFAEKLNGRPRPSFAGRGACWWHGERGRRSPTSSGGRGHRVWAYLYPGGAFPP